MQIQEGVSFQHVMENGAWIPGRLAEFLPADMIQQVLAVVGLDEDSPDRMVWTASTSG